MRMSVVGGNVCVVVTVFVLQGCLPTRASQKVFATGLHSDGIFSFQKQLSKAQPGGGRVPATATPAMVERINVAFMVY